ncbi:MAG: hypothetical protein IIX75_03920 [Clostridia bacterium]|nr:hypothetical protein [Clostridia bacterium]
MNVNWLKIGKVASIVLPLVGGAIGSIVGGKEQEKKTIETTEKLFKEHIQNK